MEKRVLELKAEVLKALAQPTRLKILECLRGGERCICEMIPAIGGSSPIFPATSPSCRKAIWSPLARTG